MERAPANSAGSPTRTGVSPGTCSLNDLDKAKCPFLCLAPLSPELAEVRPTPGLQGVPVGVFEGHRVPISAISRPAKT